MAFVLDDSAAGGEAGCAESGDHRFQFRIAVRAVYFRLEFRIERYRISRHLQPKIGNPGFTARGDGGKTPREAARRPEHTRDSRKDGEIGLFETVLACERRVARLVRVPGTKCSVALD